MIKRFAKVIVAILLIILSASLISEMRYNISFREYLAYSVPLTREEEQYLKEKEYLVYGYNEENAPFAFYDGSTEQCNGMLADYLSFLSLELGVEVREKRVESADIIDGIKNKEIDMMDLFAQKEAKGKHSYISTQSLYKLKGVMVTMYENFEITDIKSLQGRKIALIESDFVKDAVTTSFPKGMSSDFVYVKSVNEGLSLLVDGQVDALAGNQISIDYYAEQTGLDNKLRQVGNDLYDEPVCFSLNIYDTKLYNILNKEILRLKKENVLADIQEKWLGESAYLVTNSISTKFAQWIIIFSVMVVILLMIWESVLDNRIEEKTRELLIEKNNLQVVMDNINSLVAVVNHEGTIVQCNEYGKAMLDDPKGTFIGCGIAVNDKLFRLWTAYNEKPDETSYLVENRYYNISVRKLDEKKDNKLLIIEDVTEKVLTERKMRQESKMIAVGQLSAGLAHEIRNPLGLIRNYTYILGDYKNDEMYEHSLSVINDSTNRIDNLIENLLKFSRLSDDNPKPINVEKLLENIISLEHKKIETADMLISLVCPKGLTLSTREETIKIVVFNLINNAAEAFSEAGQEECKLEIRTSFSDNMLKLEVEDNGPGIPVDVMENIFNPFFTTKDKGTGLGLYIVNSELEKIGGEITAASTPGQGSIFTVMIPAEGWDKV